MLGQRRRRWTNIGPAFDRCLVFAWKFITVLCCLYLYLNVYLVFQSYSYPANTRRSPNRRRRWANVVPTLGEFFVFTDYNIMGCCGYVIAHCDVETVYIQPE